MKELQGNVQIILEMLPTQECMAISPHFNEVKAIQKAIYS